jgi:hypothetical protein
MDESTRTMRAMINDCFDALGEIDFESSYDDINSLWKEIEEKNIKCYNKLCSGFFEIIDIRKFRLGFALTLKCSRCHDIIDLVPVVDNNCYFYGDESYYIN